MDIIGGQARYRSWQLVCLILLFVHLSSAGFLVGSFFGVPGTNATFDYVIVGGGTAGLTVAKRLVESGQSVAVVEAGSFYELDNGNLSQIPAYATTGSTGAVTDILPLVDWGFITTPQAGLQGRNVHYAQGKTLGGGSARNYMAYQRGTIGSYEQWATAVDDSNYTFSNFLNYFEKSPHFTPPNYAKLSTSDNISYDPTVFSPSGGPLQVSYSNYEQPFTRYIRKALAKVGLPSIPGFNSGQLIGYANAAYTIDPDNSVRSSSESSFLQSAFDQVEPVTIFVQTQAKTILFDDSKKATGVQVMSSGHAYNLSATREVIIAAGVFKTPQLLMVSGIGPSSTLQQFDIPIISALEGVGQGIWDHPYYGIGYRVNVTTDQVLASPTALSQASLNFTHNQTGPLTNVGLDVLGWSKVSRSNLSTQAANDLSAFSADWPDFELLPISAATWEVNDTSNYMSINIATVATFSRGNVTINSTDTADPPIINPNWLMHTTDQEVAVQSLKFARAVANASGITIGPEVEPGLQVQTDEEILEYIQSTAYTLHHAVASCKMGNSTDPLAVVSTTGLVRGVSGLRIVDASTFPLLPPGHPQSTVYALAEKYADDILEGR